MDGEQRLYAVLIVSVVLALISVFGIYQWNSTVTWNKAVESGLVQCAPRGSNLTYWVKQGECP